LLDEHGFLSSQFDLGEKCKSDARAAFSGGRDDAAAERAS
jgi:hypothetical protein